MKHRLDTNAKRFSVVRKKLSSKSDISHISFFLCYGKQTPRQATQNRVHSHSQCEIREENWIHRDQWLFYGAIKHCSPTVSFCHIFWQRCITRNELQYLGVPCRIASLMITGQCWKHKPSFSITGKSEAPNNLLVFWAQDRQKPRTQDPLEATLPFWFLRCRNARIDWSPNMLYYCLDAVLLSEALWATFHCDVPENRKSHRRVSELSRGYLKNCCDCESCFISRKMLMLLSLPSSKCQFALLVRCDRLCCYMRTLNLKFLLRFEWPPPRLLSQMSLQKVLGAASIYLSRITLNHVTTETTRKVS